MIDEKIAKAPVTGSVEQVMTELVHSANVNAVFGQPVEREGATIIPCSEIAVGLGLGSGAGPVDERGNSTGGGLGASAHAESGFHSLAPSICEAVCQSIRPSAIHSTILPPSIGP